jgi:outer membrane scaffolding protein for murein synthesis (MipA/OmpV family)
MPKPPTIRCTAAPPRPGRSSRALSALGALLAVVSTAQAEATTDGEAAPPAVEAATAAQAASAPAKQTVHPLHPSPGVVEAAEPLARDGFSYALGMSLAYSPTYAGSSGQELKPRVLWAMRYGRYRISGARASGLLAVAGDAGSGASADLVDTQKLKIGASLRFDNGRSSGDDPALSGLPDIRRTLRGRFYGNLDLGHGWSGQAAYSQDLMGRGGGGLGNLGVGYSLATWNGVESSVHAGLTYADGQNMRTYFGISPEVAQATGRSAYEPRAGLRDVYTGVALRLPLAGRWTVFGGLGLSQLQGDAAASPLTGRKLNYAGSLALAWRSR